MIAALRRFAARSVALVRPSRADAESARELAALRALAEERHRSRGLTPEQAAAAAARDVPALRLREMHRDARSFPWLEDAASDVRYAVRTLARMPAFTALAVLTVAVGIGAVTVIYTVLHAVLLDPLPYPDSDRLVNVRIESPSGQVRNTFSAGEFDAFRAHGQAFEDVVGTGWRSMLLTLGERVEPVRGVQVTPNFFKFMGLLPLYGRTIGPSDAEPGAPPVAVLRHRAWVAFFAGDPDVIGRTAILDGEPRTIVGVMPPRFTWHAADLWVPWPPVSDRHDPAFGMNFQARLRPGATLPQAMAQVAAAAEGQARDFPQHYPRDFRVRVAYVLDDVVGGFRNVLYTLLAAVGLLMIMACCNVANLLLARATARRREMTVRAALGAGRGRIARQLLVESLILAATGAVAGTGLAVLGLRLLVPHLPPGPLPGEVEIALNARILVATVAVALASGLLFGLAPAFYASRTDLVEGLRGAGKGDSGDRGGARNALVVAEIALAVVLVGSAGLLVRSFVALTGVDLGFDDRRLLVASPVFPRGAYTDPSERRQFFERWRARVASIPGVQHVAATSSLPPFGGSMLPVAIAGREPAEGATAAITWSTDAYFETIGVRLLRGRRFADDGLREPRSVAVVNRTFTRVFAGGADPIGRQVAITFPARPGQQAENRSFEIVGEVDDVLNRGLREPPVPEVYLPGLRPEATATLVIRTAGESSRFADTIRGELEAVDRRVAVRQQSWPETLDRILYAQPRFSLLVLAAFAVSGLVLVALGVYSVLSYTVARRSREIAVRIALGAHRGQVIAGVLRWAMTLVAAGVAAGLAGSVATNRLLADQLWDTSAFDVPTIGVTVLVIVLVSLVACFVPARSALRVDPMVALRRD